jgi:hypothetical protein
MRRLFAVFLSGALIWQGAGGAVVLASPPDVRDDWGRVAALKPNQKVTVEVQKGRGKSQNGRFIGCDENFVMLRTGKGQDVAVARSDIRRVSATPPGREGFTVLGLIVAGAGGVALGVREVHRVNRCESIDCLTPGVSPSYYLLLGAVAAGAVAVMSIGGPRRVYEVPKIEPPPAAPRGDPHTASAAGTSALSATGGIDPARVIARFKSAPAPGLHLVMPGAIVAASEPLAGSAGDRSGRAPQPR